MTILTALVETPLIKALGATLFHSVWEGFSAALFLAVALQMTRSSRLRYAFACMAMLAIPAAFCVTLAISIPEAFPRFAVTPGHSLVDAQSAGSGLNAGFSDPLLNRLQDSMRWFVPFWLTGLVLCYVRSAASWVAVQRLR